tara:strand:- start:273 stop:467 length:195 start_codon:yes stop_codon:yes gene_type:complete
MTRRDYVLLAALVKRQYENVPEDEAMWEDGYCNAVLDMAEALADFCAADNSNFDRARFLTACGM